MLRTYVPLTNNCRLHVSRDLLRDGRWLGLQQGGRSRISTTSVTASAWSALAGQSRKLAENRPFKTEIGDLVICVDPEADVFTVVWGDRTETGSVSQLRRIMRSLDSMPQGPFRFAPSHSFQTAGSAVRS
ncbi:hypothetical protein EON82_07340 [bacterium]|nr:MAG: hypothetical protein EON82_07340 [bacterium]